MNPLEVYPIHKKILEDLFIGFNRKDKYRILDAGSGRTSLFFLTTEFSGSEIEAIVFPGDERKTSAIKNEVPRGSYILNEVDITKYIPKEKYDIVLAHLLLGEAGKFDSNSFDSVLRALLGLDTKWLIVVDIPTDSDIDIETLKKEAKKSGYTIEKEINIDKYQGFLFLKQ